MFIYSQWEQFCKEPKIEGFVSETACSFLNEKRQDTFFIKKHDVETKPKKAYRLAKIESKYGHKGSYYVQAYLLRKKRNIKILKKLKT